MIALCLAGDEPAAAVGYGRRGGVGSGRRSDERPLHAGGVDRRRRRPGQVLQREPARQTAVCPARQRDRRATVRRVDAGVLPTELPGGRVLSLWKHDRRFLHAWYVRR